LNIQYALLIAEAKLFFMKLEQQQQAQQLYFQTDLSKTQIAEALGISRRSLHYWIRHNNWERLKKNAQHIPATLAENCYYIMGHLTNGILSERRADNPVTPQEVNMLYKLTLTINKLKARTTTNESMETLARLTDNINKTDPKLAADLQPHINEYIADCAATDTSAFIPDRFNSSAHIPETGHNTEEGRLDQEDLAAWAEEARQTAQPQRPVSAEPRVVSVPPQPAATPTVPAPASGVTETDRPKPLAQFVKPEKFDADIRRQLRGTATTGPSKNFRRHTAAA
jgi:hypothetical protein